MQTTLTGIRNIIMRRGTSVSRTVSLTFQSKADISSASFTDAQVYSKQPEKRKEAIVDATNYAAKAGLDAAGAESVEFPGGFHSGGGGTDTFERLTATIKDKSGKRMYFYRKSDKTFWDRIHIPRNTSANANVWTKVDDYVPITQQQFQSKKAPTE